MKAKYLIIGGIAVATGFAGIMAAGVVGFLVLTHQHAEMTSIPQAQAAAPAMPPQIVPPQTPAPNFAQNSPGRINQDADFDEDSNSSQAYQQNAAAMYAQQQQGYEAGRRLAAMMLAQRWAQAAQSYNSGYQGYQGYQGGYYGGNTGGGGRQLSTSEKYGSLVNSGSVLSDGQGTIGYVSGGYSAISGP